MSENCYSTLHFDANGLVAAIVQDATTGMVLMQAWMNRKALQQTIETKQAVFWSRSRQSLWKKGETSGMVFLVEEILSDCDGDCILLKARCAMADGVACHTGRVSCFYKKWQNNSWHNTLAVTKKPGTLYGSSLK